METPSHTRSCGGDHGVGVVCAPIPGLPFNYAEVSRELNIAEALAGNFSGCACHGCLVNLRPEDLNSTGQICTYDTQHLKWPYLSSLVQKGKKFRSSCSAEKLFDELQEALKPYVAWAMKGKEDPRSWRIGLMPSLPRVPDTRELGSCRAPARCAANERISWASVSHSGGQATLGFPE